MYFKNILLITLLWVLPVGISAQHNPYTYLEEIIYSSKQKKILEYIADDLARGRKTGSRSAQIITNYIANEFRNYGLEPYNNSYIQSFRSDSVNIGRNVAGIVPSVYSSNKYIIVSAHYDHIGDINGYIYNGSDDNASGVTALINLAEIFSIWQKTGNGPRHNIIFVAFDAKEGGMLGSKHFVNNLKIPAKDILCAINIDQIGSVLVPHGTDTNYVIILGEERLRPKDQGKLAQHNKKYDLNLDIDFTYYGSEAFSEGVFLLSDQINFAEKGIPSLLFTSGFHRHNYKISDDPNIISYPTLKRRTLLIMYFIMHLW